MEYNAQCSRYAEPTIATSLKEHSKHVVARKPRRRPQMVVHHVERQSSRFPSHREVCFHDFPAARRHQLAERTWKSDDEVDDDGARLERLSTGRLSYSDDELSVRQSPLERCHRCGFRDKKRVSSHVVEAACHSDQVRGDDQWQQFTSCPKPRSHRCSACNPSAALRC